MLDVFSYQRENGYNIHVRILVVFLSLNYIFYKQITFEKFDLKTFYSILCLWIFFFLFYFFKLLCYWNQNYLNFDVVLLIFFFVTYAFHLVTNKLLNTVILWRWVMFSTFCIWCGEEVQVHSNTCGFTITLILNTWLPLGIIHKSKFKIFV